MELMKVSQKIEEKIGLLEKGREMLEGLAAEKAVKTAQYTCQLAVTLIKLRNGDAFELQGNTVKDPPATLCEKIAKGICWNEQLAADQAEANYKLAIEKIKAVEAELNGYQSIFRHQDET